MLIKFFRTPALSVSAVHKILAHPLRSIPGSLNQIGTEWCYYAELSAPLEPQKLSRLWWLLSETFDQKGFGEESFLADSMTVVEIGPRLNFETAWSSTAVSICHACGLTEVTRLERSIRYGFPIKLQPDEVVSFVSFVSDRMTEEFYQEPLSSFEHGLLPKPIRIIPLIEEGIDLLRKINDEMGLAMDEQDLQWCYDLFVNILKRNPTDVELFQLGQANSEHSRHGFFRGQLIIDGDPKSESLMEIIKAPWEANPGNSLIAFADDSSAISGLRPLQTLVSGSPGQPSSLWTRMVFLHPTLTAETHNFPSGVAPYPGAETGTGGRIRDNLAVGRGGFVVAAGAAYCVGNLKIPGYNLSWEENSWPHPAELASPLEILIQASNGASDYGNCFGEPVIYGFVRTCGLELPDGCRSWFKPIMFTVGAGQISDSDIKKGDPAKGMLVMQIGGPAFRIGMGGSTASSKFQGENVADLDFDAVQRGAPAVEQGTWRVIRACIELEDKNPIISVHDLGAGGDCNAIPELVLPAGAKIELRSIPVGDDSLSALEIWGNESQERVAFLIYPESLELIMQMCEREDVSWAVLGEITGDGVLVLHDEDEDTNPVEMPLENILGELPRKEFHLELVPSKLVPLDLPEDLDLRVALARVLRLVSVCSKGYLTRKVDRSVTGLIVQQQCIGPHHIPLSDYAVIAQSYFDPEGVALSLGEQPIKGLISPSAMVRLTVAEALLNMVGAKITQIEDIKCSANWMWAAKLLGEGAILYEAACALCDILLDLGIAIDGGKDSLSMAAKSLDLGGQSQIVKAPGELVISAYAPMPNVEVKVTPEVHSGDILYWIDLSPNKKRLGGSALAQVFGQLGDECPDVEDVELLKQCFETIQELIGRDLIRAVHDISDGGLIVTLIEMAMAGNVGIFANIESSSSVIETVFSEEPGVVIGLRPDRKESVETALRESGISFQIIGSVNQAHNSQVVVVHNGETVLDIPMQDLREDWEETSSEIDILQANPECVIQERNMHLDFSPSPAHHLNFDPKPTSSSVLNQTKKPKIAILRSPGSNGDREMAAAFLLAGFEPWDVTTSDLVSGRITLDDFRGTAFVGGFSFADVLDAGKGWAGVIQFNERAKGQFDTFYKRPDTFSFGVCNGCQLMALLGWVPEYGIESTQQPRFIQNHSERFESRFPSIRILPSPAIMLSGMEDSVLGVWVAHAEGQLHVPNPEMLQDIVDKGLAPIRFVDLDGEQTEAYPLNPNGSPMGITALCSADGRHLAMMPHPERTFQFRQWPWFPEEWKKLPASPWLRLFQNAYEWCCENQ